MTDVLYYASVGPDSRGGSAVARAQGIKQIAQNRKAFHDYFVLERYEAGIELFGTEVKSIRAGTVNLKDSFCTIKDGELFARGLHISPYEKGNIFNRDPMRPKRLLMHKREINRLNARVMQDGVALIPLSLYFKDGRVKLELGLCKGKKLYDKKAWVAASGTRSARWTGPSRKSSDAASNKSQEVPGEKARLISPAMRLCAHAFAFGQRLFRPV